MGKRTRDVLLRFFVTADEKAVYLKMVNRQATSFLCISCLAKYFDVDEALIYKKIEQFKEVGCMLFEQK